MARFDTAIGRYVYITIEEIEYRVYFEESGNGIPIVMQHTAGADGRQWRHMLEDAEFRRDFHLIAYDLPYHGKSVPPEDVEWWRTEYKLTKEFLMKFVLAFSETLGLDRPVYMGSSIGGHLATDLALHHPDKFRAIIGLEAGSYTPGGYADQWHHPRISNEYKANAMYGLMSPTSPEKYRRETAWVYSQGATPVFKGDLYYYSVDHDLRESAEQIDTARTPLYLLTGEYDWATSPQDSEALARRIKGARFTAMGKLGHFPASENPAQFRQYIAPVLTEILAGSR